MASDPRGDVKEYAGGWMTERKGTDAPPFLKLAYVVVVVGCIAYAILYMNGEVDHETRGALVRQFNAATTQANGFMYLVVGLAVLFAVVLWWFAFSKPHDE
jgi:hypothetical protein